MKFNCGNTWEEEWERLSSWHSFFAIPRAPATKEAA